MEVLQPLELRMALGGWDESLSLAQRCYSLPTKVPISLPSPCWIARTIARASDVVFKRPVGTDALICLHPLQRTQLPAVTPRRPGFDSLYNLRFCQRSLLALGLAPLCACGLCSVVQAVPMGCYIVELVFAAFSSNIGPHCRSR